MLFRAVPKCNNTIQRIPLLGEVLSSPIPLLPTELWRIVLLYLFRCEMFYGDYFNLEQDYSTLLKLMSLCRWAVDSDRVFANFRRLKALHGTSCLQEYTLGYNKDHSDRLRIHLFCYDNEPPPSIDRFASETTAVLCMPASFGFPRIDICCFGIEQWLDVLIRKLNEYKTLNPDTHFAVRDLLIGDCGYDHEWDWCGGDNKHESLLELYDLLTSMNSPEFQFCQPQFCPNCRTVNSYYDVAYEEQRRKTLHCEFCNVQFPGVYGSCPTCRNFVTCGGYIYGCEKCICASCLEHAEQVEAGIWTCSECVNPVA